MLIPLPLVFLLSTGVGTSAFQRPEPPAQASSPVALRVCGLDVPSPATLPPAGSPPGILALVTCFDKQGGSSVIDPQTYLYYVHVRPSQPSRGVWVPYDETARQTLLQDFRRLWATNFLDDLSIDVRDHALANGVVAKIVVFSLEERQRIKIVDYEGLTHIDRSKIDDAFADAGIQLRLDSFVDPGALRRASRTIRDLYAQAGYPFATVKPEIAAIAGGPRVVHVTFHVASGPRVKIRDVRFIGNAAVSDRALRGALEVNRPEGLPVLTKGGVYKEDRFAEDAEALTAYYRDRGYIDVRIGEPDVRPLDDSPDGGTRWVQLRIPVSEGRQYVVGNFTFDGNKVVKSEALQHLFKVKAGQVYDEAAITKGLDSAREIYGSGGYFEFTAYPDLHPRPEGEVPPGGPAAEGRSPAGLPVVDVTMRVTEGDQYFVHRIAFTGNTNTRDQVIRRELSLVEGGVFSTEALKTSIRRLNQLGYFKALDDSAVQVEKAADREHQVDVQLKLQEENRNQIMFGAGVSQYDGFFGSTSYTTANLMGRGESFTLSLQKGSRANAYQVSFTEPYLFNRPISGGGSLYSTKVDYLVSDGTVGYSEVREGASVTGGLALTRFTRAMLTYTYEVINVSVRDDLLSTATSTASTGGVPTFSATLDAGRHTQSSLSPSLIYNTVDNPYMPRRGMRLTGTVDFAGTFLGGTTDFVRPQLEAILYLPHTKRTAFGFRAQTGWIQTLVGSETLPYYLRFYLGGEYQIRGVDLRSVGPTDINNRLIGGNKFVLFNAEYYVDLSSRIRALVFHDAGQAFAEGQPLDLRKLRTSSGAELRVILPVLSVPFRLIYAVNTYRDAWQPAHAFKFAVGTTF